MEDEFRLAAHLSLRLSPPHVNVIVGCLDDLDGVFFGYRGYDLTVSQLLDASQRVSVFHHNSYRLLETIVNILNTPGGKAIADAYAVCVALSVPAYHVVVMMTGGSPIETPSQPLLSFLNHCTYRISVGSATKNDQVLLLTPHRVHRRRFENHESCRHAVEVYALVRFLTKNFTLTIDGLEFTSGVPSIYKQTFARITRRIADVFGDTHKSFLGVNVAIATFNAYLTIYHPEADLVEFDYTLTPRKACDARKCQRDDITTVRETMNFFLVGIYSPHTTRNCDANSIEDASTSMWRRWLAADDQRVCKNLTYDDLHLSVPISNQVLRVRVHSNKRLEYDIPGKSLVTMVFKNPSMTGSAYKDIDEDMVLRTENTINTNLHGFDGMLILMLLNFSLYVEYCDVDRRSPFDQSHNRYNTNSFQNGVIDTNSFRNTVMDSYNDVCMKVPNFPAIQIPSLKLFLHRESVGVDVPPDDVSELHERLTKLKKIISNCAETDSSLEKDLYWFMERPTKELVDRRSIGMFKVAHICGKNKLKRKLRDLVTCDRYLLAFDAKKSKSDFANRSRFEPDSKGKTSKRLKAHDNQKNRAEFQEEVSSKIPDATSDPHNSNHRGTWSPSDTMLVNPPDRLFYSPMMLYLTKRLQMMYPTYTNINFLLSMVQRNIQENVPGLFV